MSRAYPAARWHASRSRGSDADPAARASPVASRPLREATTSAVVSALPWPGAAVSAGGG